MRFVLLAAALIFSATSVFAAEPKLPEPLQKQRDAGSQVYYLGQYDTLQGWVLMRRGQPEFYYATPGGRAIVLGLLFNEQGSLLTAQQMASLKESQKQDLADMVKPTPQTQLPVPADPIPAQPAPAAEMPSLPAPDAVDVQPAPAAAAPVAPTTPVQTADVANELYQPTPAQQLFRTLQTAPSLIWGQVDKPTLFAFIDPNCTHCQRFLREVSPFVLGGQVAVRILPVGFSEDSTRQAAFVLAAGDGADRLVRYANGDQSAIPVSDVNTAGVTQNVGILQEWKLMATPIIIYKASDQQIRLVKGRPLDIKTVVRDLTGQ